MSTPLNRPDILLANSSCRPTSYSQGFTKPGKDLNGIYRAALLHGGPGIGKTTSAHIAAKMAGYTPLELNASDSRSKKLIENGANIDNRSLDGYFGGSSSGANVNAVGMEITSRTCLIMDEVDGMSAGDRGGVGALNALIKKTKVCCGSPPPVFQLLTLALDRFLSSALQTRLDRRSSSLSRRQHGMCRSASRRRRTSARGS